MCPFCDKEYAHYASRARHIAQTHPENNSDDDDDTDDHDAERMSESDDNDGDSHDEEEMSENDDQPSTNLENKLCLTAWRTVTNKAIQRIHREKPFLSLNELWEEPKLSSLTLPMIKQIIVEHTSIVDGIQSSTLYNSLEKIKKKLLTEGLKDWEAGKTAWEKRKYYIKEQLQNSAESDDD